MKYLYGAAIQGIQSFIFETNKLKEIAGASELVDYICTDLFRETIGQSYYNTENLLIGAAGNIKYLFEEEKNCQNLALIFPRRVMQLAPGITISQAVVKVHGDLAQEHIQQLEARLKIQRNRSTVQHGLGLMISERSRRTGKPGINWTNEVVIDAAQQAKRNSTEDSKASLLKKLFPDSQGNQYYKLFPVEMEDIARKDKKNWVAVIHADGNDLGKKIMAMVAPQKETFRDLSEKIGNATEQAVRAAFELVVKRNTKEGDLFPFRPIVLGGDDLTVIIRGDLAIDFTHAFLKAFEEKTLNEFQSFESALFHDGLTACAGIAYIKANYPFHYGAHLAEMLCNEAKKVAKEMGQERTPSCLLFHKVHSSFIEGYKDIVEQELTINQELPAAPIRLDFGPYFLNPHSGHTTVAQLNNWIKVLNEDASPKSRLRNWVTELRVNQQAADQQMDRIRRITSGRYVRELNLKEPFLDRLDKKQKRFSHTHLFDAIALSSI
jgi:hypothetical protein